MNGNDFNPEKFNKKMVEKRMPRANLAAEMDVDMEYITKIADGLITPTGPTMRLICMLLHCSPEELCGPIEQPIQRGYEFSAYFDNSKVYAFMAHNGQMIAKGYAHVSSRGSSTPVDMAQAFSYAAHMAFKNMQCSAEMAALPVFGGGQ